MLLGLMNMNIGHGPGVHTLPVKELCTRRSFVRPPFVWLFAACMVGLLMHSPAQAGGIDEEKAAAVKAAYLFNFTKFVQWPKQAFSDNRAPFVIGVMGDARVAKTLKSVVQGKRVQNRPLVVREIKHDPDGKHHAEMRLCHVLFIGHHAGKTADTLQADLKEASVLSVSDIGDFCGQQGAMEFKLKGGRITLRISLEMARRRALSISSKLLRLAEIVKASP